MHYPLLVDVVTHATYATAAADSIRNGGAPAPITGAAGKILPGD
jgi:hypothetical protein